MLGRTRTAIRAAASTSVPRSSPAATRETRIPSLILRPGTRAPSGSLKPPGKCSLKSRRKQALPRRISPGVGARQCVQPRSPSRPRFSAPGDALAFAVEFHGALADREVGGRLDLLHERRRLGVCLKLAAFGRGLVYVREDHRRRLDEVIDGVRAGLEEARVRPEV